MPGTKFKVCPAKECVGVVRRDGVPHCAACGSTLPPDEVEVPYVFHPLFGDQFSVADRVALEKQRRDAENDIGLLQAYIGQIDEALAEPPIVVRIAE